MDKIPARLSRIQFLTICPFVGEISTLYCAENYKPYQLDVKRMIVGNTYLFVLKRIILRQNALLRFLENAGFMNALHH
jgi:hypothetical protein